MGRRYEVRELLARPLMASKIKHDTHVGDCLTSTPNAHCLLLLFPPFTLPLALTFPPCEAMVSSAKEAQA